MSLTTRSYAYWWAFLTAALGATVILIGLLIYPPVLIISTAPSSAHVVPPNATQSSTLITYNITTTATTSQPFHISPQQRSAVNLSFPVTSSQGLYLASSLIRSGSVPEYMSSYVKPISQRDVLYWRLEVLSSAAAAAVSYAGLIGATLADRRLKKLLGDYAYHLLVASRGSGTRLRMLKALYVPSTRYSLTRSLNMDWKEVERNLGLLVDAGLVREVRNGDDERPVYIITEDGLRALEVLEGLPPVGQVVTSRPREDPLTGGRRG